LRRQAILNAAREVFEGVGYFNATMAQIAAKAEFGVGTIYQFFPGKQHLFVEVILLGIEDFLQKLKEDLAEKSTWRQKAESFIGFNLQWIEEHPAFYRLIFEIFYSSIPEIKPKVFERFKEIHQENFKIINDIYTQANREDNIYDPDLMSLITLGTIQSVGNNWYLNMLDKSPTGYIPGIINGIIGGRKLQ